MPDGKSVGRSAVVDAVKRVMDYWRSPKIIGDFDAANESGFVLPQPMMSCKMNDATPAPLPGDSSLKGISMEVVLVMFKSDGNRRSFSLGKDLTVIGRREDCDLRIPLGEISRKHCRLIKDGDILKVEDLGSSNGTYHNGQRVQEAMIQPGDTVQVGSIAFVVQIGGAPADDELQPILATPTPAPEASAAGGSSAGGPSAAATSSGSATGADAFDPMSILESTDSNASDGPMDLDVNAEQSHSGQNAEA
jgi:pSer/pThr/pTyr-binding forkhead associated (FHA) protein